MATTTVTAGKQAEGDSGSQTSWTNAKDATSATISQEFTSATDDATSVQGLFSSGRGGGTYRLVRTFLFFDVSGVPGTITAMDLDLFIPGFTGTAVIKVAKSTAFGTNGSASWSASDFDNWSQSSPTAYLSNNTESLTAGARSLTLNSTAISHANSDGYLNVVLVDSAHDFNDSEPLLGINRTSGIRFQNSSNPIQLDITYTPSYSNDVIGVPSTNIVKVIGVPSANITKVIGV